MKSYFYIIAATAAMAMEYLLLKMTGKVSPYLSGLVIFAAAGILLGAGAGKQQKRPDNFRRFLPLALLVGVIGTCCNFMWISGTRLTSASSASTLGRLDVVFTLALAAVFFGEKISFKVLPFIALSVVGAVMLSGWDQIDVSAAATAGNILVIAAALMLSLNSFIIKRISGKLGPMRLAAVNCMINALAFGTVWLSTDGVLELSKVSLRDWVALLACGFCSFIFFSGYYSAVRELPVWEVRLIALAAPLFTAIGGYFLLDEIISLQDLTGMLLLLSGTAALVISGTFKLTDRRSLCAEGAR